MATGKNKGIDKICSNPEDTSFVQQNSEYPGENTDDNDRECEYINKEGETQEVAEDVESTTVNLFQNQQNNTDKNDTKSHENRSVSRSQLQATSQLASCVNKLVEVGPKRLKLKERDRRCRWSSFFQWAL